ncbi:MAG TPA: ClpX C4-type zinc finger protein [Drouetiella sp.]
MFGFGKPKLKDELDKLSKIFDEDMLEISRARSKMYARVSYWENLFDGENYDVDTNKAYFKGLMNGDAVSFGPLQVVGTYFKDSFMWSWNNESIPAASSQQLKEIVDSLPDLKKLANFDKFQCEKNFAERMSQWLAVKSGWLGAFESPYNQAMVFMILKLTCFEGHSVEPNDNMWCSLCGRLNTQVAKLLAAAPTCAICNECIQQFHDIKTESSSLAGDSKAQFMDIATMPPCLVCGDRTERIFTDYGSLCHPCLDECIKLIA